MLALALAVGGVISTFLTIVHGQPPGLWREWLVSNASLTEVAWDPVAERGRLLRRGDDAHLAELNAWESGLREQIAVIPTLFLQIERVLAETAEPE